MAAIRSYTTIEQSKVLAKILPHESADMYYREWKRDTKNIRIAHVGTAGESDLSCWSLAALLSVIPQEIFDGEYIINITEGLNNKWILTYDHHENRNHSYYGLSVGADNLVDACVAMIEKLHELKLM